MVRGSLVGTGSSGWRRIGRGSRGSGGRDHRAEDADLADAGRCGLGNVLHPHILRAAFSDTRAADTGSGFHREDILITITSKTSGGKKFSKAMRQTLRATGAKSIEAGFFSTARYPDGKPVAAVASRNEFGTGRGVPARPFFRLAVNGMQDDVMSILKTGVDPQSLRVSGQVISRVGAHAQGAIQESITRLRKPPNAPSTRDRKGSSNPLVDTGTMRAAVSWREGDG